MAQDSPFTQIPRNFGHAQIFMAPETRVKKGRVVGKVGVEIGAKGIKVLRGMGGTAWALLSPTCLAAESGGALLGPATPPSLVLSQE